MVEVNLFNVNWMRAHFLTRERTSYRTRSTYVAIVQLRYFIEPSDKLVDRQELLTHAGCILVFYRMAANEGGGQCLQLLAQLVSAS